MTERVFTAHDKLRAVENEIRWRRLVYPRRIDAKSMSQRQADNGIAVMQAIAEDYRKLAEKERLL